MIPKCFRLVITYPGADVASDHNPLIAKMTIKLKKVNMKRERNKINASSLENPILKETLRKTINKNIDKIDHQLREEETNNG